MALLHNVENGMQKPAQNQLGHAIWTCPQDTSDISHQLPDLNHLKSRITFDASLSKKETKK